MERGWDWAEKGREERRGAGKERRGVEKGGEG